MTISVAARSIDVALSAAELATREGPGYRIPATGYLSNFRQDARGLETGGVLLPAKS
jgi:dihydroxy-acid dehydratase